MVPNSLENVRKVIQNYTISVTCGRLDSTVALYRISNNRMETVLFQIELQKSIKRKTLLGDIVQ